MKESDVQLSWSDGVNGSAFTTPMELTRIMYEQITPLRGLIIHENARPPMRLARSSWGRPVKGIGLRTAQLMAEFYRDIEKDGLAPAAALGQAQVEMWKKPHWPSPYYWAAFQLQGEWK